MSQVMLSRAVFFVGLATAANASIIQAQDRSLAAPIAKALSMTVQEVSPDSSRFFGPVWLDSTWANVGVSTQDVVTEMPDGFPVDRVRLVPSPESVVEHGRADSPTLAALANKSARIRGEASASLPRGHGADKPVAWIREGGLFLGVQALIERGPQTFHVEIMAQYSSWYGLPRGRVDKYEIARNGAEWRVTYISSRVSG